LLFSYVSLFITKLWHYIFDWAPCFGYAPRSSLSLSCVCIQFS